MAGLKHSSIHDHGPNCPVEVYNTRDLLVRDDIMTKARELAGLIYSSEEVQVFRRAEKQIQGNDRVQTLMAGLKKKQKELVAFEQTFKNASMVQKIETEMDQLQDELDGIPIVGEFQQSQADINYLLQMVVSIIQDTVADKIALDGAKPEDPESCDE
ncbi:MULTISPECIES: YlbF family regulator [unclassified Paenibacillus]|uniref:RicAFT regulatory complex protein RicA family protein n=1 Tax=unclassified Paenibacillus TaxID=185978 RepID=UPI001F120033|nr:MULTISPECIES: YlbF family regulator [unclassified Paenibacillus]